MPASHQYQTPVVLIVFNRPHLTRQVIDSIRMVRPERLFVISDGPRAGNPDDRAKIDEVRRLVAEQKDYAKTNLGCALRVSTGLDNVFAQVEKAVILEDDCVANQSFFAFCEQLLETHANNVRVMHISGDNFLQPIGRTFTNSYYFSIHAHCWGWATWRRAWRQYDHTMKLWPEFRNSGKLRAMGLSAASEKYFAERFSRVKDNTMDSWAFRWTFACWFHGGLAILPAVNLVRNIGFGTEATHTREPFFWVPSQCEELSFPLTAPREIAADREADAMTNDLLFSEGFLSHLKRRWLQWKASRR
jgi:hypothetical protein